MPRNQSISLPGAVLHDAKRLGKIISVFSKYGMGALFGENTPNEQDALEDLKKNPATTATKIRSIIEELGTTYIKFGQMLSTRGDIFPKEIIDELSKLQDTSPMLEFSTIETILNEHYGDWHNTFETIDSQPLGSASIAQVHRATLKDGSPVVIKVQRPNLLPLIRSDVDILHILARLLDNYIEEIAYFNLPSLISEFERTIVAELDFNNERANIEHFITHYSDDPMLVFPTPYGELSGENILVMKELPGKKITTVEPNTPTAHAMAQTILSVAFKMIFKDGVFHGDPHPGNVFAMPDGRIALLDFGAVGTFSPRQRDLLMRLILAAHLGDCGMMARTLLSLGRPTKRVVLSDLENDIADILQRHLKQSLNNIDMAQFAHDFVSAGQKYAIQIPSEFSCAVRALLSIEGIIQYLEPELDVIQTLSNYAHNLLNEAFGKDTLKLNALQIGLNATDFARTIPLQVSQIMQDLEYDGLSVRVRSNTGDTLSDAINSATTRLCLSIMAVSLTICMEISHHNTLFILACIADVIWCYVLLRWHFAARTSKSKLKVLPILEKRERRKKWF